jgi:hypothetical protein
LARQGAKRPRDGGRGVGRGAVFSLLHVPIHLRYGRSIHAIRSARSGCPLP